MSKYYRRPRADDNPEVIIALDNLVAMVPVEVDEIPEVKEARAQREWLIKECARVGVTVNVQIGAPLTEAYQLELTISRNRRTTRSGWIGWSNMPQTRSVTRFSMTVIVIGISSCLAA